MEEADTLMMLKSDSWSAKNNFDFWKDYVVLIEGKLYSLWTALGKMDQKTLLDKYAYIFWYKKYDKEAFGTGQVLAMGLWLHTQTLVCTE